jgi:hypothetical protein
MSSEPGDPVWEGDDEIVAVLFIHGGLHLREFIVNRGMVPAGANGGGH